MNYLVIFSFLLTAFCPSYSYASKNIARRNLLDVVRLRDELTAANRAPAPTTGQEAQTPEQPDVEPLAQSDEPQQDPSIPLPEKPEKPVDLTDDQKELWDKLAAVEDRLMCRGENEGEKDFSKYYQAADELKDIIDADIVGTDNRDVIASEPALQQYLLYLVLTSPRQTDLFNALSDGQINQQQYDAALQSARHLHHELFAAQWRRLQLDQNEDFSPQVHNVQTAYNNVTNQELSGAEQNNITEFSQAVDALNDGDFSAAHVQRTLTLYKQLQKQNLLKRSSMAREAVAQLTTDIPEGLDEQTTQLVEDLYDEVLDDLEEVMPNPQLRGEEHEDVTQALADVKNTESPSVEATKLLARLARTLYTTPDLLFTDPAAFEESKEINPAFFANANINVALFAGALSRLDQLTQSDPSLAQEIQRNEVPVISALSLPESFFEQLKQQSQSLRYALAEKAIALLKTLVSQRSGTVTIPEAPLQYLAAHFDNLMLATPAEEGIFDSLSKNWIYLVKITATLDPSFQETLEDKTLLSINTLPDADDAPADLQAHYTMRIEKLTRLLVNQKDMIAANYRLRHFIINPETNSTIINRVSRTLSARNQELTTTFLSAQSEVVASINNITGTTIVSSYAWDSAESDLLNVLNPLVALTYLDINQTPPRINPKVFEKSDNIKMLISYFEDLSNSMTDPAEQERRNAIAQSVKLRKKMERILGFPDAFFKEATSRLSDLGRYKVAGAGALLMKKIIAIADQLKLTPLQVQTFKNTLDEFNSLAISKSNEREMHQVFKRAMTELVNLTGELTQANSQIPTGELPSAAQNKKIGALLSAYSTSLVQLTAIMDSRDERRFIGNNHRTRKYLFDDNGFVLLDIPEGVDARGKEMVIQFLKRIKHNPKNFNYAKSIHRAKIESQLDTLIEDAQQDERSQLDRMKEEAKDLYGQILQISIDYTSSQKENGKLTKFGAAATALYRLLSSEKNRELIGDKKNNEPLYNLLFSPRCLFKLPEGVDWMDPRKGNLIDKASGMAALSLYRLILENKKDLGLDKRFSSSEDDHLSIQTLTQLEGAFSKFLEATEVLRAPEVEGDKEALATAPAHLNEEDRKLFTYIVEMRQNLSKDSERFEAFAKEVYEHIDSRKERQMIRDNSALKKLIFSNNGLLMRSSELPKSLTLKAIEAGLDMFNALKANPKEFGYKDTDNAIVIEETLEEVIRNLKGRKEKLERSRKLAEEAEEDSEFNIVNKEGVSASGLKMGGVGGSTGGVAGGATMVGGMIMTAGGFGATANAIEMLGQPVNTSGKDWNDRQKEVYKQCYKDYLNFRSDNLKIFLDAVKRMHALTSQADQSDSWFRSKIDDMMELHRLLDKKELKTAFHKTVLIPYLPSNIGDDQFKTKRREVRDFYRYILNNPRRFDLGTVQYQQVKSIIEWLKKPETAPQRTDHLSSDLQQKGATFFNPLTGGYTNAGLAGGKQITQQLSGKHSGMMGMGMMNPMMMGGMGMMNPMMNPMMGGTEGMTGMHHGMMGMGMNPMMMGGMGMRGGSSNWFITQMRIKELLNKRDKDKAQRDELAKLQQTVADLKAGKVVTQAKDGGDADDASEHHKPAEKKHLSRVEQLEQKQKEIKEEQAAVLGRLDKDIRHIQQEIDEDPEGNHKDNKERLEELQKERRKINLIYEKRRTDLTVLFAKDSEHGTGYEVKSKRRWYAPWMKDEKVVRTKKGEDGASESHESDEHYESTHADRSHHDNPATSYRRLDDDLQAKFDDLHAQKASLERRKEDAGFWKGRKLKSQIAEIDKRLDMLQEEHERREIERAKNANREVDYLIKGRPGYNPSRSDRRRASRAQQETKRALQEEHKRSRLEEEIYGESASQRRARESREAQEREAQAFRQKQHDFEQERRNFEQERQQLRLEQAYHRGVRESYRRADSSDDVQL